MTRGCPALSGDPGHCVELRLPELNIGLTRPIPPIPPVGKGGRGAGRAGAQGGAGRAILLGVPFHTSTLRRSKLFTSVA